MLTFPYYLNRLQKRNGFKSMGKRAGLFQIKISEQSRPGGVPRDGEK